MRDKLRSRRVCARRIRAGGKRLILARGEFSFARPLGVGTARTVRAVHLPGEATAENLAAARIRPEPGHYYGWPKGHGDAPREMEFARRTGFQKRAHQAGRPV